MYNIVCTSTSKTLSHFYVNLKIFKINILFLNSIRNIRTYGQIDNNKNTIKNTLVVTQVLHKIWKQDDQKGKLQLNFVLEAIYVTICIYYFIQTHTSHIFYYYHFIKKYDDDDDTCIIRKIQIK